VRVIAKRKGISRYTLCEKSAADNRRLLCANYYYRMRLNYGILQLVN